MPRDSHSVGQGMAHEYAFLTRTSGDANTPGSRITLGETNIMSLLSPIM